MTDHDVSGENASADTVYHGLWPLLFVGVGLLALSGVLIIFLSYKRFRSLPSKTQRPARTLIVLGSGGHTAEMLALVGALNCEKYCPVTWVLANTDKTSLPRLERDKFTTTSGLILSPVESIQTIPRSREVGQSWLSTIWTTFRATLTGIVVVFRTKPDVILINGPGTCIPIVIGAVALRCWRGLGYPKIIFIESFCRVRSLSMTGKLLYPLADRFIVQWPDLCSQYKHAEYLGAIY